MADRSFVPGTIFSATRKQSAFSLVPNAVALPDPTLSFHAADLLGFDLPRLGHMPFDLPCIASVAISFSRPVLGGRLGASTHPIQVSVLGSTGDRTPQVFLLASLQSGVRSGSHPGGMDRSWVKRNGAS